MSQITTPLNGGREQIQTNSNPVFGSNLSRQYQIANRVFEVPNEWVKGGRPIYWRLPSVCQQYRIDFGFDGNSAFVYVPAGQNIYGKNTVEVVASENKSYLIIKSGTVVWKHGSFFIDPIIINLETIGMSNAKYTIAYRFLYDDSPVSSLYSVEDYSLSGYTMNVGSGTDSVTGWRYTPKFAFCSSSPESWRNYDGVFPSYSGSAYLYWQFPKAAALSKIVLRCPENSAFTGSATLSTTNCFNPDPENPEVPDPDNPYCDTSEWTARVVSTIQEDTQGQYFSFEIPEEAFNTGWRIDWTDPKISINSVKVTGTIPIMSKPATGKSTVSLVAYPFDSLPPTVTNEIGEKIPAVYCKLANVDVSNSYEVQKVTDLREIVGTDYQPIADWLTKPWDDNLIDLYNLLENYPTLWMNPQKCLNHEYLNLSEDLIEVQIEK